LLLKWLWSQNIYFVLLYYYCTRLNEENEGKHSKIKLYNAKLVYVPCSRTRKISFLVWWCHIMDHSGLVSTIYRFSLTEKTSSLKVVYIHISFFENLSYHNISDITYIGHIIWADVLGHCHIEVFRLEPTRNEETAGKPLYARYDFLIVVLWTL